MASAIRIANRAQVPNAALLVVSLCLGIASQLSDLTHAEKTTGNVPPTASPETERGLTSETAIPLQGYKSTLDGIAAEHEYLDHTYPGWALISQAVVEKDSRVYDLMNVKLPGRYARGIFDITDWYGAPLFPP